MIDMRGFSLIELVVVIAIMSILASIGLPLAELSRRRANEEELRRSLREIRGAIDAYKRMVDDGRIARTADGSGYPSKLQILVDGIPDAQSPQGTMLYFLRRLPRDPFFVEGSGDAEEAWGLRSYASSPSDPQPGRDVYDVYSRATGTGMNGLPYRKW